MPPLLSHLSGRTIESIVVRTVRLSSKTPVNQLASICVKCQWRAQFRYYSDNHVEPPPLWARGEASSVSTSLPNSRSLSSLSPLDPLSSSSSAAPPLSKTQNEMPTARFTRQDLPSQEEDRRSQISKRFSENFVRTSRLAVRKAKDDYSNAISQRSASQREVNELLQRKHAWSTADLERFTSLYRSDHANEQNETVAQAALAEAERVADEAAAELSKSILARYHEEQIWSDKIRRMSTWGTWGLMGVNVLLFLVFQIGVEPWRRNRLVKGFEEKVKEALGNQGTGLTMAKEAGAGFELAAAEEQSSEPPAAVPLTNIDLENTESLAVEEAVALEAGSRTTSPLSRSLGFGVYRVVFRDLFSERKVSFRKLDVTIAALEGVATGAVLMGFIVALLRWR
ncbi:MAG: sensitivity to high expression protein she9 [Geoglossum simile]|nr:MAG: sensitivity to high expression protein she9 [Geoglossum simile]